MTNQTDISLLGYLGAALLGLTLNRVFDQLVHGELLIAITIYISYFAIITTLNYLCTDKKYKFACQFNDIWFTINEFQKNKLNFGAK